MVYFQRFKPVPALVLTVLQNPVSDFGIIGPEPYVYTQKAQIPMTNKSLLLTAW